MMDVSSYHHGHTVSLIRRKYENKKSVLRVEAFFLSRKESVNHFGFQYCYRSFNVAVWIHSIHLFISHVYIFRGKTEQQCTQKTTNAPSQNHIEKIVEKPPSQTSHHQPLSRRQSHNVNVEDIIAQQVTEATSTEKKSMGFSLGFSIITNWYRFKFFIDAIETTRVARHHESRFTFFFCLLSFFYLQFYHRIHERVSQWHLNSARKGKSRT